VVPTFGRRDIAVIDNVSFQKSRASRRSSGRRRQLALSATVVLRDAVA
jgi:hypothetical protein